MIWKEKKGDQRGGQEVCRQTREVRKVKGKEPDNRKSKNRDLIAGTRRRKGWRNLYRR